MSQAYIDKAIGMYGARATFICDSVRGFLSRQLPAFDVAIAIGVLHHLDDDEAGDLFTLAFRSLVAGGRLISLDGCLLDRQSFIARFLIRHDRGRNVRSPAGYVALASRVFGSIKTKVEHDGLRIPYTHFVMECTKEEEGEASSVARAGADKGV